VTSSILPQAAQAAAAMIYLLGRPTMGESIHFLQTQTLEGANADIGDLATQWRAAKARIDESAATETNVADASVSPVSETLKERADAILESPLTKETFGVAPTSVQMVDLNQVIVYQKFINLMYAEQLRQSLGADATEDEIFSFALPTDGRYDPLANAGPIHFGPHGPSVWAMVSPSGDFRVLNTIQLDPSQVTGLRVQGRPTHVFGVVVGYGSNYLSGIRVGKRIILRNGSHRAYTLLSSGYTRVPMLIQDIDPSEDELLPPEVTQQKALYLEDARPPLLRDYLDDSLRVVVHVSRKSKQIRVQVAYEEGPALGL
jgi:hypothetical protein